MVYRLKLPVLEEAILSFAQAFGLSLWSAPTPFEDRPVQKRGTSG